MPINLSGQFIVFIAAVLLVASVSGIIGFLVASLLHARKIDSLDVQIAQLKRDLAVRPGDGGFVGSQSVEQ